MFLQFDAVTSKHDENVCIHLLSIEIFLAMGHLLEPPSLAWLALFCYILLATTGTVLSLIERVLT